jgi:leucyl aminopeptidase
MNFTICSTPESQKSDCLVLAAFEKAHIDQAAGALPDSVRAEIDKLYKHGDFTGKEGSSFLLQAPADIPHQRLLLVGCGKKGELDDSRYRKAVTTAINALKTTGSKNALVGLTLVEVKDRDLHWKARQLVEATGNALYNFNETKSEKNNHKPSIKKLMLAADKASSRQGQHAIKEGSAIVAGMNLAKDLGNLPGNICTPTYLADEAKKLAAKYDQLKVTILEEKDMKKLGMGALLSVSRGSRQPAKLIVLEYKGGKKDAKPQMLVGKGLTFDAGGISIKPSEAMDEMKYDMCGGASVLGTIKAVCEMSLNINLVGIVPSSENLPDGDANKPGDIVTSMSGQTIEILNTDAEGRLILCDALSYAEKFKPAAVVDIATLTGACVIALGKHASGLLGNHQPLMDKLLEAGTYSCDRAWQLPLWDEYQEQLKSNFADMANIGGRGGGTITAACFLSRYAKKYHWAHLDIAGTAWLSGAEKGGTGRPVPLLTQYLLDVAGKRK